MVGINARQWISITLIIKNGDVIDAAINKVTAPIKWHSTYKRLAGIHLSATIPSRLGINTEAIPMVPYTAPTSIPVNFNLIII